LQESLSAFIAPALVASSLSSAIFFIRIFSTSFFNRSDRLLLKQDKYWLDTAILLTLLALIVYINFY
jgi:hypothetical protein